MLRTAIFLLLLIAQHSTWSQPGKAIRLVLESGAGSSNDGTARLIAEPLAGVLNRPVIVENKPGAEGLLALESVRNAPADGQTLALFSFSTLVATPLLQTEVRINPLTDFTPISLIGRADMALSVHPAVPATSLNDFLTYARQRPGELNYAAVGAMDTLIVSTLMKSAGINLTRVGYKNPAQALLDVVAGRVEVAVNPVQLHFGHAKEGHIRILALFSDSRVASLPDIPTAKEAGFPELVISPWYGVFAPAGMDDALTQQLAQAVASVINGADLRQKLERRWLHVQASSPGFLHRLLNQDLERWAPRVRNIVTEQIR